MIRRTIWTIILIASVAICAASGLAWYYGKLEEDFGLSWEEVAWKSKSEVMDMIYDRGRESSK